MATPPSKSLLDQLRRVVAEPITLDEVDDPAPLIAHLPAQTFVRLARALRDEERLELLLPHATAEQLTSLMDIDAWKDDRVDIPRARSWLLAIAQTLSAAAERGTLSDRIHEMDPEMWTFGLSAGTVVIDLDPSDDGARDEALDQIADLRAWETPDGFFVVGVPDSPMGRATLQILNRVYADDLATGRRLALSLQSVLAAQVEEDLLHWRSGRLADLGFVSHDEAMRLFRPLDHDAAANAEPRDFRYLPEASETGLDLQTWSTHQLLQRVMGRLDAAQHGVRSREFLLLVNEVMAAQLFPPGAEALQERAIHQTQSTICLGLEMLASTRPDHPDPDAFLAERVRDIGLRDIFRVGYGALDKLRKAVHALDRGRRISLTAPASLLDRPWGPAIVALMPLYPELALTSTSTGTRPLRGLADVARATQSVAEAEALARLTFEPAGYGVDPIWLTRVDEPERMCLGDLVRTAIVHTQAHGGSGLPLAPLGPEDLAWARRHLVASGELASEVRRDFSARCDALGMGRHAPALAQTVLQRLWVELVSLEANDAGDPDLTRVSGLLTVQQVGMWLKTRAGSS